MTMPKRVALTDANTGATEVFESPPWGLLDIHHTKDGSLVVLQNGNGQQRQITVRASIGSLIERFHTWHGPDEN